MLAIVFSKLFSKWHNEVLLLFMQGNPGHEGGGVQYAWLSEDARLGIKILNGCLQAIMST
jgi:hypothetical protein